MGEGFESLWIPEVIGRGFLVPDPFVTLAVAATATVRKIVSGMFMSLDGVVQADDDWRSPTSTKSCSRGSTQPWRAADAVVMGRRSFEGYNALRVEHPESPMLAFLERAERYVATTTMTRTDWPGTTVLGDDLHRELASLKHQPGANIDVAGSPTWCAGCSAAACSMSSP